MARKLWPEKASLRSPSERSPLISGRQGSFLDEPRDHDGARLQLRLAYDEILNFAFDAVLVDGLPAGRLVELQAQRRQTVLISILHLRLASEQAGQHVVPEGEIRGGARRDDAQGKRQSAEPARARAARA